VPFIIGVSASFAFYSDVSDLLSPFVNQPLTRSPSNSESILYGSNSQIPAAVQAVTCSYICEAYGPFEELSLIGAAPVV
jgi:hypothetical protein